jgi:hypothetical protein
MLKTNSSGDCRKEELYEALSESINQEFDLEEIGPIIPWAEGLLLDGRPFALVDHEYQQDIFLDDSPRQVFLKGAQVGMTSVVLLKTLYGLIASRYPQGVLYLLPSRLDVQDFSRGRFGPLLNDNEHLAKYIQDTDAQSIKRIGKAMLYLRGAKSTSRIQGMKRSSSALKSIPCDRVCFDESDEMEPAMIDLALERMSHSTIKEEIYLSTPSIPSYGVDALFQTSDQRHWFIKCGKCGGETCLELEFPGCLEEIEGGRVIRLCQRCRDQEIFPKDGFWKASYPAKEKDMVGWRISQLNSMFVDPGKILRLYYNPPNGNLTEVYNSKLAQAHIAAENRITVSEVLELCDSTRPMKEGHPGPTYLGCDVGSLLHCVIGRSDFNKGGEILYVGSFPDWNHLNTLMKRFNVSRAVIDALPELRLARDFAQRHRGKVFCCFYQEHQKGSYAWNEKDLTVRGNRTEILDSSHAEISLGKVILPAESETLHEFAQHLSNTARVLQQDVDTGSSRYIYVKTGPDHYRHAQSYEVMARSFGRDSVFFNSDLT